MNIFKLSQKQYVLWGGFFLVTLILLYSGCSSKEKQVNETPSIRSGNDPKPISQISPVNGAIASGRKLFETLGCMGCHTVNGQGGQVGPNLSDEGDKGKSRQWLTTQIRSPKTNDPQTIMPAYANMTDEQINDLVDYLMSLSGGKQTNTKTQNITNSSFKNTNMSLSDAGQKWSDICGQCHNLRPPSEYSDAQWAAAMDQMRLLVPLTGREHNEILKFLQASN